MAVGHWVGPFTASSTLAESSSATPWPILPSPNKGAVTNTLNGVACPAATFCAAVGSYDAKPGVPHTLVEQWNGSAWSVVSSPNFGTGKAVLNGVSCLTPASCVAVGYYLDLAGIEHGLIERWNGTAWATTRAPSPGAGSNLLNAVSCASAGAGTRCVAVGHAFTSTGAEVPLVESSSGGTWTVASSPSAGPAVNDLAGVSCPTTNFCAAVGSYLTAGYQRQTLVEGWNGATWSVQPSANQGAGSNALLAISCASSAACMAVGTASTPTLDQMTLAESWNGAGWAITPSPNGKYKENRLSGVTCTAAATCVAVGHSFTIGNTADVTLAELYQ